MLKRKFNSKIRMPIALAVGFLTVVTIVAANANGLQKPAKDTLMLQDTLLPSPEFNTKVRTITWPVGYISKVHSHPGPGPRYVLAGTVEISENGQSTRYSAGDVFWYSAKYPHQAKNVDTVDTTVLIIELLPKE